MKHIILSAALAFAASSAAMAQAGTYKALTTGSAIPAKEIKMQATDGKSYSLTDAKTNSGLLVMFSCNTCPYVVKSQERTKEVISMAKESGIGVMIINSNAAQRDEQDSYAAMQTYAEAQGYDVPYVLDEKNAVANAFGATRTPEVFLFNAKGKLVYSGAMEDNPSDPASSKEMYLANALKKLNTKVAIQPAATKSIGCSIKR